MHGGILEREELEVGFADHLLRAFTEKAAKRGADKPVHGSGVFEREKIGGRFKQHVENAALFCEFGLKPGDGSLRFGKLPLQSREFLFPMIGSALFRHPRPSFEP